ncbi:MAG TPA: hypothetical protein VLQ89_02680, partial [Candidatus Binatia bacterium]|nr:hypothetical protein [Candidatus Binatia bacterium]
SSLSLPSLLRSQKNCRILNNRYGNTARSDLPKVFPGSHPGDPRIDAVGVDLVLNARTAPVSLNKKHFIGRFDPYGLTQSEFVGGVKK